MLSLGIDIGSVASKAALYDGDKILARSLTPTGWSPVDASEKLIEEICQKADIARVDIGYTVGTGYGRVSLPNLDQTVTEISCHGKGAYFEDQAIRTVLDIGGQDSKVIKLGPKGQVVDFLMNDKCAAGTGRFLQVMANTLGVDIGDLSDLGRGVEPAEINSMCTVFAESEVVSLIAKGEDKSRIAAGLLQSIAGMTYSLLRRVGIEEKVFFSGGVSKNPLLLEMLEDKLKVKIEVNDDSQFLGAIGAALIGYERSQA